VYPLDISEIQDIKTLISSGLCAIFGPSDENCQWEDYLLFDQNKLHIESIETLNSLPVGYELIFVPTSVARPASNERTEGIWIPNRVRKD